MVTFGEDSLNDRSEEKYGFGDLRHRLGAAEEPDEPEDSVGNLKSPTDAVEEEVEGVGEAEEEAGGAEDDGLSTEGLGEDANEPGIDEVEPGSISLAVTDMPEPGKVKKGETEGGYIERRLLEGASREELVAEGKNPNSVRTIYSTLKGKGLIKPSKALVKGKKKDQGIDIGTPLQIFAKGSPPEAIIGALRVPDVSDGQGFSFEQGMKFGLSVAVLGIRMAQELSGIGIMQAKPLLDMAKSMREGEAIAAKNAAGDAAMEAAGMVRDSMMPMLTNISRGGGEGGDPMRGVMARTMEPILQRLMGSVVGRLTTGPQTHQLAEGKGGLGEVEGWSRRSE